MRQTGSSKGAVYAAVPLLSSGGGSWEFLYDSDVTGNESMCFGFASKPATSTDYDTSANLWTVRAYNGHLYGSGKKQTATCKLSAGCRIVFRWDVRSGDVSLEANGVDQGVVFGGVTMPEIWPCCACYGAGAPSASASLTGISRGTIAATVTSGGDIASIVGSAKSADAAVVASAISRLAALTKDAGNRAAIAAAGGIVPLVSALSSSTERVRMEAADGLGFLACRPDLVEPIIAAGAIAPLLGTARV